MFMYDTLLKITKRTRPNFWSTTTRLHSKICCSIAACGSDDAAPTQCWRPSHAAMTLLLCSADAPLTQQWHSSRAVLTPHSCSNLESESEFRPGFCAGTAASGEFCCSVVLCCTWWQALLTEEGQILGEKVEAATQDFPFPRGMWA